MDQKSKSKTSISSKLKKEEGQSQENLENTSKISKTEREESVKNNEQSNIKDASNVNLNNNQDLSNVENKENLNKSQQEHEIPEPLFKSDKDKEQMDNLLEELNKDIVNRVDDSNLYAQQIKKPDPIYNLYDFLFPEGKLAKLCRINDISKEKEIDLNEIVRKFKFQEASPVVILSGAKQNNRGKFFAGIARACFRTDAVIIDSGIEVGVESFALRQNIKLIGVAPEKLIKFPKINPTSKEVYELSNGHTHLFLLNSKSEGEMCRWSDESKFRFNLAQVLAQGKFSPKYANNPRCKIVVVLLGDNDDCLGDLEYANDMKLPVIVTRGSDLCEEIIRYFTTEGYELQKPYLYRYLQNGHFYILGSNNSEEIASFLHFFLTVTPYDTGSKQQKGKKEDKGNISGVGKKPTEESKINMSESSKKTIEDQKGNLNKKK